MHFSGGKIYSPINRGWNVANIAAQHGGDRSPLGIKTKHFNALQRAKAPAQFNTISDERTQHTKNVGRTRAPRTAYLRYCERRIHLLPPFLLSSLLQETKPRSRDASMRPARKIAAPLFKLSASLKTRFVLSPECTS